MKAKILLIANKKLLNVGLDRQKIVELIHAEKDMDIRNAMKHLAHSILYGVCNDKSNKEITNGKT